MKLRIQNMRNVIVFLAMILLSCSNADDKLLKQLVLNIDQKNKKVTIDNFPEITYVDGYYSTINNSQYFFEELDRKFYQLLLSENGVYKLSYRVHGDKEDKYGNKLVNNEWIQFGYIDCTAIKKYKNFDYWSQNHKIISGREVHSNSEYLFIQTKFESGPIVIK